MNNSFSIRRFAQLARKHYAESGLQHALLAGGILLLLALPLRIVHHPDIYYMYAAMVFLIGGLLWLHRTCRSYYRPEEAQAAYTLPAAQSEKYLFCWMNSYVVYVILFYVSMCVVVAFSRIGRLDLLRLDFTFDWLGWRFLLFATLIHAFALFSCSWARRSPIKGYLLVGGIALAALIGYLYLSASLTHMVLSPLPGSAATIILHREGSLLVYTVEAFRHGDAMNCIAASAAALLFWVAGYFKFRERTLK